MASIIHSLRNIGLLVRLSIDGKHIEVQPQEKITDGLSAYIKRHRDEIITELRTERVMPTLDAHYKLTESSDYDFVANDVLTRPEMLFWAEREVEKILSQLNSSKEIKVSEKPP